MDMCAPKVSWHAVICGFLIINRKNLPAKEDSRLEVDLYVCVLSLFSDRLKAPPPSWPHQKRPVQAPMRAQKATNTTAQSCDTHLAPVPLQGT